MNDNHAIPGLAKVHELKIWPEYFDPLYLRRKKFDVRKNDRGFKVGDVVVFKEWDPATKEYTTRESHRIIQFIEQGIFGLPEDVCVLGF
jgi:ribosomal protein S17